MYTYYNLFVHPLVAKNQNFNCYILVPLSLLRHDSHMWTKLGLNPVYSSNCRIVRVKLFSLKTCLSSPRPAPAPAIPKSQRAFAYVVTCIFTILGNKSEKCKKIMC